MESSGLSEWARKTFGLQKDIMGGRLSSSEHNGTRIALSLNREFGSPKLPCSIGISLLDSYTFHYIVHVMEKVQSSLPYLPA